MVRVLKKFGVTAVIATHITEGEKTLDYSCEHGMNGVELPPFNENATVVGLYDIEGASRDGAKTLVRNFCYSATASATSYNRFTESVSEIRAAFAEAGLAVPDAKGTPFTYMPRKILSKAMKFLTGKTALAVS